MTRNTADELTSEQITETFVSHLFQNDNEFRDAIIKHIAQNGIKNDPNLRKIFKEKSHSVMNRVFGFRNRGGASLAPKKKDDPKKAPKKDNPKKEVPAKPTKKPRKNVARTNRLTHEKAIVSFLEKNKKPASARVIANALAQNNHKVGGLLVAELSRLKGLGVLATVPHQGKEPKVIYDWLLAGTPKP